MRNLVFYGVKGSDLTVTIPVGSGSGVRVARLIDSVLGSTVQSNLSVSNDSVVVTLPSASLKTGGQNFILEVSTDGGAYQPVVSVNAFVRDASVVDLAARIAEKEDKPKTSLPIYLYGNSYSILTSTWHTTGNHYAEILKNKITAGTVTSYGRSGKRILDVLYSLINESVTGTALITTPIAGSKWPGTASRTGLVILESAFNDIGHYPTMVGTALPAALPGGNTQYRDCLKVQYRAALAIMSSASRIENASFTTSGTWTRGSAQAYASGGLVDYTTANAAYSEVSVTPPQRGPLAGKVFLLTYTIPTGVGTMAPINVSVDGGAATGVTVSPWESYLGPSGGSVNISPYVIPVTVPIDGNAHTVRFTHNGAAGNLMYVDCLLVPSEDPNPIAVMGCERGPKVGAVWNAAQVATFQGNMNTLIPDIKSVAAEFPNAFYVPSTMTDNGLYSGDGIHPNDRGMAQRANDLYHALKSLIPRFSNNSLESKPDSDFAKI